MRGIAFTHGEKAPVDHCIRNETTWMDNSWQNTVPLSYNVTVKLEGCNMIS